jgi:hypothetical protein
MLFEYNNRNILFEKNGVSFLVFKLSALELGMLTPCRESELIYANIDLTTNSTTKV